MISIEYKPTSQLIPYVNNSRIHSEQQIKQVASSIKEFGFTNPILIDEENGIIAGHCRVQAAEVLNLEQVPTITLNGLTESQKKAYVIADNKLALNASWDLELLQIEMEKIEDEIDLNILGFNEQELNAIIDELNDDNDDLKEETYTPAFSIIVNCKDEQDQEKIFNELKAKGYECQVQSL